MSDVPPTLTEQYKVRAYEVGPSMTTSLPTIANYLQETAGNHADKIGVGADYLMPNGVFWVLSRLRLIVDEYPGGHEDVDVLTWPSARERFAAFRDFRLMKRDGSEFGRATTAWLIFDLDARKMIELPKWVSEKFPNSPPRNLDFESRTIPRLKEVRWERVIVARKTDQDMLGHVNNVHYLEWSLEAVSPEWELDKQLLEIDIQFRAEGRAGEELVSRCGQDGGQEGVLLHSIFRPSDGVELARARTIWKLKS